MRGSASLGESRLGNRRVVFGTRIDPIFLGVAVIFFTIVSLLSLVAGIAVWPVGLRMRYLESVLGEICPSLNVAGVVSMAVLAAISLAFMLWQHVQFSIYKTFGFNLLLFWLSFSVVLLTWQSKINALNIAGFMSTLLWIIFSFIAGYVLAVLPAVMVAAVVGILHKVIDAILPT